MVAYHAQATEIEEPIWSQKNVPLHMKNGEGLSIEER